MKKLLILVTFIFVFILLISQASAPTVTPSEPTNASSIKAGTTNVHINWTYTDDQDTVINCSLYIDNVLTDSNGSSLNNTLTDFYVLDLSAGTYDWYVSCKDNDNDIGNSSLWRFTTSSSSSGSSVDYSYEIAIVLIMLIGILIFIGLGVFVKPIFLKILFIGAGIALLILASGYSQEIASQHSMGTDIINLLGTFYTIVLWVSIAAIGFVTIMFIIHTFQHNVAKQRGLLEE